MGSGAIGIEFASFYNSMGVDVTVVELMPQVMPVEDAEISKIARKQLEKHGLKIITEAKVTKVDKKANSVKVAHVETKDGKTEVIEADRLISAVGVQGNIENLGLEDLGVKTDRGCVVIDGYGKTNVEGIYAIGDVAGPPMLAHKAEHEGVICVEKIAGVPGVHPMDKSMIPGCTYCHPQVASVGLTEAKAKEAGHDIRVGRFPFVPMARRLRSAKTRADQDDLRQEDRAVARRAYGRRGSHRTDPGFRRRHEPGDDRGRADAHGLPASDAVGNDEGKRARRLWACLNA
jgi:dihydrolipoamide dehydrogenase